MTYVGQQPATTFDSGIQDRFTGLTTNTVTLTHEISAEEDILVVWNNIVQDKNTYSVGGTGNKTVTLGGTLVSADVVTVYYLNKVMQSVNPTAGSVGITELNVSDGSNGQALTTNGSGTLSFATVSADADNYFASSGLSSKDLGTGLHIKTGDSGATANSLTDELVIEGSGDSGLNILSGTSSSGAIYFGDSGDDDAGRIVYYHGDNSMRFVPNGSESFRIESDGQLLCGFTSQTNNSLFQMDADHTGSGNGSILSKCSGTGEVFHFHFQNGNGGVGGIKTDGSSTAYATSSDYRLKENVSYTYDATTRLKQLKPARFNFKSDSSKTVDGFLAHEVSSIVPEAITGTKDETKSEAKVVSDANGNVLAIGIEEADWTQGKTDGIYASNTTWNATKTIPVYQAIDQAKLVPLLVKTVQELEARIKTLEDA